MDIINIIIYVAIAISGTVFGSFFTLAVHRIPKKQDITHERSYCPNCNHKLGLLDLIPVWSYIFLGGKCRYCKNKIRPRYLILEICSGLVFLFLAFSRKLSFESSIYEFIYFFIDILFLCAMFIIAGIDKEIYKIPNGLIIYGLIIGIIKCIVLPDTLFISLMGLIIFPLFIFIIDIICQKIFKYEKEPIGYGDVKYLAILGLYFGFGASIIGIWLSIFISLLYVFINNMILKNKTEIPFGFCLTIGFTILLNILPYVEDLIVVCNNIIGL